MFDIGNALIIKCQMGDSWFDNIANNLPNPEPVISKETESLVNDFLSPAKLRAISGKNDLRKVNSIEMKVNTAETTLGNFGQYLPSLKQLKLTDSFIPSVRDIGTSFSCLTVLWISRCHLDEVDGIASMQALQELYISYNNIIDLSPISFLENLEVLDLEGNRICDSDQIDYLSIMLRLTTLTLTGNPVCQNFKTKSKKSFRNYVLRMLPQLEQFDDLSTKVSNPKIIPVSHSQEDIDIITNAIKDGVDLESDLRAFSPDFPVLGNGNKLETSNSSTLLPASFLLSPLKKFTSTRPVTAAVSTRQKRILVEESNNYNISGFSSRPGSSESDDIILASDDSSNLTFGDPLCGNPMQALKQRRKGPMPAFNFLSNEADGLDCKPPERPMTSLGFKRQVRLTDKGWLNFLDKNIPAISTRQERNSDLENSPETSKESSSQEPNNHLKNVTKPNGIYGDSSSSFSETKKLPSKPFSSPTPPPSPQRPSSARDFRFRGRRRTYSSGPSQSQGVVTVSSVDKQCKNSIQSQDQTT